MTGHIHQWNWDSQWKIPQGVRCKDHVRWTDEIYKCECGGTLMSATRITLEQTATWTKDMVVSY